MNYIKLSISIPETEQREILIAMLADNSFEGFEEAEDSFSAFIPENLFSEDQLNSLAAQIPFLYTKEVVPPQNWNAKWEADFEPVIVGDFCTVRASFHNMEVATKYEVVITPKMSFGTGHHATTQQMIEQMEGLDFTGKKVLDFGTGTGLLAILASKLGAERVVAIDNDDWSYENSIENVEVNGCINVDVALGSLEDVAQQKFNIILANINRHILLQYMQDLHYKLDTNGQLLMSGLLVEDFDIINQAATQAGLVFVKKTTLNNWISILYSNN